MGWRGNVPDGCPLTDTEYEILSLVSGGRTVKQIARERRRSPSAVRTHLCSGYRRLGVATKVEAVIVMKDSGWLGAPPRQPPERDPPLTYGQMLYLKAFDELLAKRTPQAEAAVTICFAAMCWEAGTRPRRRVADVDGWLESMARRLTAPRGGPS